MSAELFREGASLLNHAAEHLDYQAKGFTATTPFNWSALFALVVKIGQVVLPLLMTVPGTLPPVIAPPAPAPVPTPPTA